MQTNITKNDLNGVQTIDYNKELNSKCSCKRGLVWNKHGVVMLYPCEHMYHKECINDIINDKCKFCKTHIEKIITLFDEDLHYQRFADLLSVTYYDNLSHTTPSKFIDSIFDLASIIVRIPMANDKEKCKELCEKTFALNNLTMKVYGLDKIKLEKYKVYICNHVTYLELAIIYYLLGTGFLASTMVNEHKIIDQFKSIVPMLIIKRGGNGTDIVSQMREFVDKYGSICLFPEGIMKHPDSLIRFRTGAFHIGRPIYAIVMKYNNLLSDAKFDGLLYKLGAKRNMAIEVHILGPYYPPFNNHDIENIRMDMAKRGNMVLSRVSNRDVTDD